MRNAALACAGLTVVLAVTVGLIASVDRQRAAQHTAYEQSALATVDELVARVSFEVERQLLGGVGGRTDAIALVNEARGRLSATVAPADGPADTLQALDAWLETLGRQLGGSDDATPADVADAWDELVAQRRALGEDFADPVGGAVAAIHEHLESQQTQQDALVAFDQAGAQQRREERAALRDYAVEVRAVLSDVEQQQARLDDAALAERTLDTEAALDEAEQLVDDAVDALEEAAAQLEEQDATGGFDEPQASLAGAAHDFADALEDVAPVISRADCTAASDPDDCAPIGEVDGYSEFAAAHAEAERRYLTARQTWSQRYNAEVHRLWGLER